MFQEGFQEGQLVFIDESSSYADQIGLTDGNAGVITRSYKTDPTYDESRRWYSVQWANGYSNGYQRHDLRLAAEQFSSNKHAAKLLLKEEYE